MIQPRWILVGAALLAAPLFGFLIRAFMSRREGKSSGPTREGSRRAGDSVVDALTSFRAKAFGFLVVVMAGAVGILWVSWTYAGPISTIVYLVLFVFSASFFFVLIGLFGSAVPLSGPIGKLHLILGAFAFGNMILVQLEDRWDLCPATDNEVYIEGEWHEIQGGHTNWSILGWRPFGILRYKTDETLQGARVDTKAERGRNATADGGEMVRGGFSEKNPPAVTGIDGEWLVDLKRVYSQGIKRIGDIELIETAEEITARKHASEGLTDGLGIIIGPVLGLLIGVVTAYFVMG